MTIDDMKNRILELSNRQSILNDQEESDLYEMQGVINAYREEAFNDYLDALQRKDSYRFIKCERKYDSICDISNDVEKVLNKQYKLKYPDLFH